MNNFENPHPETSLESLLDLIVSQHPSGVYDDAIALIMKILEHRSWINSTEAKISVEAPASGATVH